MSSGATTEFAADTVWTGRKFLATRVRMASPTTAASICCHTEGSHGTLSLPREGCGAAGVEAEMGTAAGAGFAIAEVFGSDTAPFIMYLSE
jgi:hypothetical protein